MFYVYLLQSDFGSGHRYVGLTRDLRQRLRAHNAGNSPHTAKYKPWRLERFPITLNREAL
jgi:putative endonuclease